MTFHESERLSRYIVHSACDTQLQKASSSNPIVDSFESDMKVLRHLALTQIRIIEVMTMMELSLVFNVDIRHNPLPKYKILIIKLCDQR
jgi:hypothetical protein